MWIWIVKGTEGCRKAAYILVLLEAWRGLLGQGAKELVKEKEVDNGEREGIASGTYTFLYGFFSDRRGRTKSWQGQRSFFCLSDLFGFKHHCLLYLS